MVFMEACEKNFKACEEIIRILYENVISVSQSCAILDHAPEGSGRYQRERIRKTVGKPGQYLSRVLA